MIKFGADAQERPGLVGDVYETDLARKLEHTDG